MRGAARRPKAPCKGCGFNVCQCLELAYLQHVTFAGLPAPIREFPFAAPRKLRADFAWPDARLLVEIEGGTWSGGRHSRGAGYRGDCEKYNLATLLGWRLLRFTSDMVKDGSALQVTEQALGVMA